MSMINDCLVGPCPWHLLSFTLGIFSEYFAYITVRIKHNDSDLCYLLWKFLGWKFCEGHESIPASSWRFGWQHSGPARSQCSQGWPLPSGDPGERLQGAMGLDPGLGRWFRLRVSPWSCQSCSSSSCHPASMCAVTGPAQLQPPAGQHSSLGAQGGTQCPGPELHLLQRLHCESNLKHRNEKQKFRFKGEFASSAAVSKLKMSDKTLRVLS